MKNIYFVGQPTEDKGIEEFGIMADKIRDAKFYWFCFDVSDSVKEKYKNISFVVGLNDKEMRSKIKKEMDLFVSCSHFEGFGLPTAEAILLDKPVLSYALEEVRSCYGDDVEYIGCFDLERYISRINTLVCGGNYMKNKEKAKEHVIANYSPETVARRLLKALL